jgi:hypothetical protein
MPRNQHAVFRRHEIRLDIVRAHFGGKPIAGERVLGAMSCSPAVPDDQRRRHGCRHRNRRTGEDECGDSWNLE